MNLILNDSCFLTFWPILYWPQKKYLWCSYLLCITFCWCSCTQWSTVWLESTWCTSTTLTPLPHSSHFSLPTESTSLQCLPIIRLSVNSRSGGLGHVTRQKVRCCVGVCVCVFEDQMCLKMHSQILELCSDLFTLVCVPWCRCAYWLETKLARYSDTHTHTWIGNSLHPLSLTHTHTHTQTLSATLTCTYLTPTCS